MRQGGDQKVRGGDTPPTLRSSGVNARTGRRRGKSDRSGEGDSSPSTRPEKKPARLGPRGRNREFLESEKSGWKPMTLPLRTTKRSLISEGKCKLPLVDRGKDRNSLERYKRGCSTGNAGGSPRTIYYRTLRQPGRCMQEGSSVVRGGGEQPTGSMEGRGKQRTAFISTETWRDDFEGCVPASSKKRNQYPRSLRRVRRKRASVAFNSSTGCSADEGSKQTLQGASSKSLPSRAPSRK